jgi:hypothetical protein
MFNIYYLDYSNKIAAAYDKVYQLLAHGQQELQEKSGCCPRKTTNSRQQRSQQAEVRTGKHSKFCIT